MSAVFTPTRLRITVGQYQKMGKAGVFSPDARVELIEGEILSMAPIGTAHANICDLLVKQFVLALGNAAVVRAGNPVDLGDYSEPEPDLSVLRPQNYRHAHPQAADVLLLIEVSDSSLGFDQGPKRDLYAKFGVPEYWVIDVNTPRVVVYRDPVQGAFRRIHECLIGDVVLPQAFPNIKITVGDLFT